MTSEKFLRANSMKGPSDKDGITLDAMVCIQYALRFGKISNKEFKSFTSDNVLMLVNKCQERSIPICYFKFIADEAYKNLAKAVNNFCNTIHKRYLVAQFSKRAKENLDRLFERLEKIELKCTPTEYDNAKKFFEDNEVDVRDVLKRHFEKDNIPDDQDILLLISTHNQPWELGFILSDDGHFLAYKDIIEDNYDVEIIPMDDILRVMIDWKWIT